VELVNCGRVNTEEGAEREGAGKGRGRVVWDRVRKEGWVKQEKEVCETGGEKERIEGRGR